MTRSVHRFRSARASARGCRRRPRSRAHSRWPAALRCRRLHSRNRHSVRTSPSTWRRPNTRPTSRSRRRSTCMPAAFPSPTWPSAARCPRASRSPRQWRRVRRGHGLELRQHVPAERRHARRRHELLGDPAGRARDRPPRRRTRSRCRSSPTTTVAFRATPRPRARSSSTRAFRRRSPIRCPPTALSASRISISSTSTARSPSTPRSPGCRRA